MARTKVLRITLYGGIAIVFTWSLLAILVTGPVMRRPPGLDLGYELPISSERLQRDVERLCTEFAPRSHDRADNLDAAAEWIAEELRRAGLAVEFQDYELPEGRFRNVVGFREGLEPDAPVRVLGAHYDAFGAVPGANDNASGVAVLLELARALPFPRPRRNQYFVAFSTEEPPFFATPGMGSHVFAKSLKERGVEVDLMIALDLVGYFTDIPGSQDFPLPGLGLLYPSRGNFIAVVGDLRSGRWLKQVKRTMATVTDLPVHSFRGPASIPGVAWSDHRSFREQGMPGVLVTDTAFLRYPWYHTEFDTPEKLDYERMAEVVRGLYGLFLDRDVAD